MKKTLLAAFAAFAVMSACHKNEPAVPDAPDTLKVWIETVETKTYMDANNNIRWSSGDQVVAFMKSSLGLKYQILSSSVGKVSASFEKVSGGDGNLNAGTEWDHNVAFYPYAFASECEMSGSNYVAEVCLPEVQSYAEGSFGKGAMPMAAVSEDNDITFRNICGGMKLQLRGTQKVASITLEGKNSERLSGVATVTAYPGETKPAITMSSGASTSVTLNCGSGVQLSESKATSFIIALPPVLFSQGFTVTVTDTDDNTYVVETDQANAVLRSSLLKMPAFKLGSNPSEVLPDDDELIVPVSYVNLNSTSLALCEGDIAQLLATVAPVDATDKTVVWSSDNPAVASVDQTGLVSACAAGTANITAVADGKYATCCVTVSAFAGSYVDYVDEYGINHGPGIRIGNTVWAPVNCGYHAEDFKYGKLYQWGRKFGQGYSGSLFVDGKYSGEYSDAAVPTLSQGGVSAIGGNHKTNADVFYFGRSEWVDPQDDYLWNSGTESEPVKTDYDPCPEGWRVPTYTELNVLGKNSSSGQNEHGQSGSWFSGESSYNESVPQVFLPAAGYRDYDDGSAANRGAHGYFWSSTPKYYGRSYTLRFRTNFVYESRAYGLSVRCVQDNSSSDPEQEVEITCVMMEKKTKSIGFDNMNIYLTGDDFVDVNGVDYPVVGNGTNTFTVKVPKADSYTISYPADAVKENTDGTYSVNIPDEYVGSSFGVFIGQVADESLKCNLEAVCGIVMVDASAYADWDRLEFKASCGTSMWGNAVLLSDYTVSEFNNGKSMVTVERGDEPYFFMPLLPAFVNGVDLTVYNKSGEILCEPTFSDPIEFKRGMMYHLELVRKE